MTSSERQKTVLRIIVEGYIHEAIPIASKTLAEKYGLKVSSATIRNDMVLLEEEGYITRPHASAGSVPTDKAYRYYVESIDDDIELSLPEQYIIHVLSREIREEMEQWLRQAATLLAHLAHNLAVVTLPRAKCHHFKHMDLVVSEKFLALLILVLREVKVIRKMMPLDESLTQDKLTELANKFNDIYDGMDRHQILNSKIELSPCEKSISRLIAGTMAAEDMQECGKPYLEGLCLMLSHPEFFNNPRVPGILEILENEKWIKLISSQIFDQREKTRVIIGEENPEEALQDLSLIVSQYGVPGRASGLLGVVGPKRMDYARTISSLKYFTTLLSDRITQQV